MQMADPTHLVDWQPIGQTSNQLILYHPPSHGITVRPHPQSPTTSNGGPFSRPLLLSYRSDRETSTPLETISSTQTCPYCYQPLPSAPYSPDINLRSKAPRSRRLTSPGNGESSGSGMLAGRGGGARGRYFQILEQAHEGSRPPSPSPRQREKSPSLPPDSNGYDDLSSVHGDGRVIEDDDELEDLPGKGYYERFFKEECRLGIGAEGSVYLATHVIGGNILGTYAVKKIAVGSSKSYLVRMLREVRLLETLRHPNIIPYHHAWIEPTRFSSFGPPINALHVLMMYASAGNLDTFLLTRSHSNEPSRPDLSAGDIADNESLGQLPKAERIKAFKKRKLRAKSGGGKSMREETRGVLLLSLEEIVKLFGDVVEGLAFLHANSILHLDLKCSNVLLHWEEGALIPKAMISDFGTSEEMLRGKRERTGHTGTMEYMAPETLIVDATGNFRPSDSHADMWSLGMILHKLLFLHLPYSDSDDFSQLQSEILAYQGFMPSAELIESCKRRHLPRDLLLLLSSLVNVLPEARPSSEKVRMGLRALNSKGPSTSFGGLMTKFRKPFGASPLGNEATIDRTRDQGQPDMSPVRPVLALPSPEIHRHTLTDPIEQIATLRGYEKYAHTAILGIKVLLVQPRLIGDLPFPMIVCLIILALAIFHSDSWSAEGVGGSIHLAILAWYLKSGSNQPQHELNEI